jgi:hypothetical protein
MAAKSKVTPVAKKGTVAKKATVAKAKPKGLQLNAAQWKAYNKAYSAAYTAARKKLAISGAAQGLRKYRLGAAYATIKKANIATHNAQAAAVAAYATRMSWNQSRLAHQNSALQARIEQDMYTHAQIAGKLQYIQGGEKAYAHTAVMRTLDTKQAMSIETKIYNRAYKAAKKASKSLKKKVTVNGKIAEAAAAAAGLAAAKEVPGGGVTGTSAGSVTAKGHAKATAKATTKATLASKIAPAKASASATAASTPAGQKVAPVKAKARGCVPLRHELEQARKLQEIEQPKRNWLGDENTPNCIIIAVANSLLLSKGILVTEDMLAELTEACGDEPSIEQVLWKVYLTGWPDNGLVRLKDYQPVPEVEDWELPGLVIGFKTEYGDHCSLSLDEGVVVSWGSTVTRTTPVEEAWELLWQKLTQ